MAEVDRIRLMGSGLGENSRQSRFDLKDGEVRELVNLVPGKTASPRGGCPIIGNLQRELDWIFPFRDNVGNKLSVAKSGVDLVQVSITGQVSTLVEGAFPAVSARPCAQRIKDSILISCDKETAIQAYVVTKKAGNLLVRPANLDRPASTDVTVSGLLYAPGDEPSYAIPARSARKIATTWVIRDDADGISGTGTPLTTTAFGQAIAESWEDLEEREIYPGSDSDNKMVTQVRVTVSDIPQGATHLRIWISLATQWSSASSLEAEKVAAGAYARFWIDISVLEAVAVTGGYEFLKNIEITEGELQGQSYVTDTTGASEMPACSFMLYHNGLLWAGGSGSAAVPGRCFYSLDVSDPPIRTLSLFDLGNRYVDTSIDGTEQIMGIAASHGHLIFLNEQDIWRLPDGNPENAPIRIAQGMGTMFPNSISEQGQRVWYLSNYGPAVISDDIVELVEPFNVSMVWPESDVGVGYFHTLSPEQKLLVRSWWKEGTWYISNGIKTCAMKMDQNKIEGGYQIEIASGAEFSPNLISWFGDKNVYAFGNGKVCHWAVEGSYSDGAGYYPTARLVTRPGRVDGRRREKVGEVIDILVHARWNDPGQLQITCLTQWGRSEGLFNYEQRPITEPLQNTDINNAWRGLVQQGVQEGLAGSWFEVGIRKIIRGFFEIDGLEIGIVLRSGHEFEYVSMDSEGEDIPELDQGMLAFDMELNRGYNG